MQVCNVSLLSLQVPPSCYEHCMIITGCTKDLLKGPTVQLYKLALQASAGIIIARLYTFFLVMDVW